MKKFIAMSKFKDEMIFLTDNGEVYQMFFDHLTDVPVWRKISLPDDFKKSE